jgi:hypothetical protein
MLHIYAYIRYVLSFWAATLLHQLGYNDPATVPAMRRWVFLGYLGVLAYVFVGMFLYLPRLVWILVACAFFVIPLLGTDEETFLDQDDRDEAAEIAYDEGFKTRKD